MGQHAGQLRPQGDEEGFVLFVVAALVRLLHHQDAQHAPLVDDRHSQEAGVALFPGLGEIEETGVGVCLLQVKRLLAFGHQADEALTRFEDDLPHRLAVQADGFHQHQFIVLGIVEIE